MNVMHVILTLEQGGAQEVVRLLCAHQPQEWRVPLVVSFEDGPVRGQLERLGVRVEVLGLRRHGIEALPGFLAEGIAIRRRLRALSEEFAIDLVQTHLLETLDFHVLTLLGRGRPGGVIWTIHNVEFLPDGSTPWLWLKQYGHRWLYRLCAGRVSAIVAVSASVRDAFVDQTGVPAERVRVIANGVDCDRPAVVAQRPALLRELGLAGPVRLALVVGRLAEQKGHRVLIEAAAKPGAERGDLHFVLVGEGPLDDALRERVRAAGLATRFHFLGVRSDVPALLAACDLFVQPSLWEGLSVALLEAMAAARPIVATEVSGAVQAMVPDETGLLVPPGDAAALAAAIGRTLADPDAAERRGRLARERVRERFSVQAQVRAHSALYDEVLHARRALP